MYGFILETVLLFVGSKKQVLKEPEADAWPLPSLSSSSSSSFGLFLVSSGCWILLLGSGLGGGGLDEGLVGISLLKGETVEPDRDGKDALESVGDTVRDGGLSGEVGGEGKLREHGDGGANLGGKNIVGDVKDLGVKQGAVVVDHLEAKTVGEGADVELLEESGLGGANPFALGNEVSIVGHLNLSLGNLGGNLEGLEERSLSRVAASGALGDDDVAGGNAADTGRGGADVLFTDGADLAKVTVGEDEANVALAQGGKLADGAAGVLLLEVLKDLAHHGVLAHEDLGLAAEANTGVLELLGTNVVDLDDKGLGVGGEERLHLLEVLLLAFTGERHVD
mmetsp:Transcript_4640/g.8861  ORF Transcript_4640/g.8861 Transcript_4640/m.8861 type:complete len:337 (-) Transcript_4640:64-1074(-)